MSENQKLKNFSIISIALFLAVLILPTAIWVVGKLLPGKPINVFQFDLGENRAQAQFPTEYSSTLGLDLEAFYNDRLPFRSVLITANRGLTAASEKPYDNIISPFLVKTFYSKPSEDGSVAIDYMPPKVHNNLTIQGRDGWLFLAVEGALDDYLGTNILSEEEMEEYLTRMVKLQEICMAQGKELYFIIPPNKAQVYPEKMPSYTIENDYRRVERLVDYIRANSDIKIAYPLEEMIESKELMQLYFKTDTHWNEAGAFIGVQALYSLMGMPTTDLESLSYYQKDFNEGDLIPMGNLNREDFPADINFEIEYRPEVGVTALDDGQAGDPIYKTVSNSTNECNFCIIGDSYRAFMSKYIMKDFSHYYQLYTKFFSEPGNREIVRDADIIVVECVERFNSTLLETLDTLCDYLEQ